MRSCLNEFRSDEKHMSKQRDGQRETIYIAIEINSGVNIVEKYLLHNYLFYNK